MNKKNLGIDINEDQRKVLEMAIEFYIRLGLGQFSEIATRIDLLCGKKISPSKMKRIRKLCDKIEDILIGEEKPWSLSDDDISLYTLNAFLIEAQLFDKTKTIKWAEERIAELKEKNKERI